MGFSHTTFTRDVLNASGAPISELGSIIPNQHTNYDTTSDIARNFLQQAKSGMPLYVGIIISYTYSGNQQGEYGIIAKYNNSTQQLALITNWAK